ncbi:hypothetical protein GGI12_005253 [Dipsacomyces acuminosporus]|nr:hypothetical protein GGI12_005253 [Dipsacomyces acuminosporus]
MGVFDLRTEFVKYGEYHANRINVAIHMVFVPTILWTLVALGTYLIPGKLFTYPAPIAGLLSLIPGPAPLEVLSTLVLLGYSIFYIVLDKVAGLLFLPILYTIVVTSQQYIMSSPGALKVTVALNIVSWIVQFIGHGVFEKRAPALVDNIGQALVMAPFFVFLEVLFALGYRPDLHRSLRSEVGVRILAHRRSIKYGATDPAQ